MPDRLRGRARLLPARRRSADGAPPDASCGYAVRGARRALVLGGGGLVGLAWHAGALKALEDRDIDVASSDLVVGTSAGAIVAAYLAAGWGQGDLYEYMHGRHPLAQEDEATDAAAIAAIFFRDLPEMWPRDGLYVCTVESGTKNRVVFGAPGAPKASLPLAVLASCALPDRFPAVEIDGTGYSDGGAYSATSVDVAVDAGCDSILCLTPQGYLLDGSRITSPALRWQMLSRYPFVRRLRKEVHYARNKGIETRVLRPHVADLLHIGRDLMRPFDRAHMADLARAGVTRTLEASELKEV
ncbi:MAG: patatin-like phospholipase family protein [Actinobacteria bacterium]|nr:patatin-like phospholipase family protein [Actinomycetota bacterium]